MSRRLDPNDEHASANFMLSVANIVVVGGFVMVGVVLATLFIGLWADRFLGTRPLFTIGFLVLSAPLSIYLMLRIATKAIAKIKPLVQKSETQGEKRL